jgi:hypothetical protein
MYWLATAQKERSDGRPGRPRRYLVSGTDDPGTALNVAGKELQRRQKLIPEGMTVRVLPLEGWLPDELPEQQRLDGPLADKVERAMGILEAPVCIMQRLQPQCIGGKWVRHFDGMRVHFRCHEIDRDRVYRAMRDLSGLKVRGLEGPLNDGHGTFLWIANIEYDRSERLAFWCAAGEHEVAALTIGTIVTIQGSQRRPVCKECLEKGLMTVNGVVKLVG